MKKKITPEEIKHVAILANLRIGQGEAKKFSDQISQVIEFNFDHLNKIDTNGVSPTAHALGVKNRVRDDTPEPGLSQKKVLQNSKETHNGFFKVEAILNKKK